MKFVRVLDMFAGQGSVDFERVKAAGIAGVIHKCTEGRRGLDPAYYGRVEDCGAAGIPQSCYHFAKPGGDPGESLEQDAELEARAWYTRARELYTSPRPWTFTPWLDLETLTPKVRRVGETEQQMQDRRYTETARWLSVFLLHADALFDQQVGVYTGAPWALALRLVPGIADRPLWVAGYPQRNHQRARTWEEAERFAATERDGWPPTVAPWPAEAWVGWQFSGGMSNLPGNRVDGVQNVVDCNLFRAEWWDPLMG